MAISKPKHQTREAWLTAALWGFIDQHFTMAGYDVPSNIRVTCGFPAKHALARKVQRVGECWAATASMDGTFEISVSPVMADPLRVLGILVHEIVHATVGLEAGHRSAFSQAAAKVGLTSPWTSTGETDDLKVEMASWLKDLGSYPHAALLAMVKGEPVRLDIHGIPLLPRSSNPPQSTRMLLLHCTDCGCKVRTTSKWIKEYGERWDCPCGGHLDSPGVIEQNHKGVA